MKKYQVIINLDRSWDRSYYQTYLEDGPAKGNIECYDLPPYADINKARACYWDSLNEAWIFDEEKYNEFLHEQEQAKNEADRVNAVNAATPSNVELAEGMIEVAEAVAQHDDALVELGEIIVAYDNAIVELGNLIASQSNDIAELKTTIENLRTENQTSTEQQAE